MSAPSRPAVAAILATYQDMTRELEIQSALSGLDLAPIVAFLERQRAAAAAALQELDQLEPVAPRVGTVEAFGREYRYLKPEGGAR